MSPPAGAPASAAASAAVPARRFPAAAAIAWAVLALVCTAPFVRASLRPPPGREFLGTLHFTEDVYNYFGYVEQAREGAFLFRNRLALEPHAPALVNLEWWAVGRLSALLGGELHLSWRLFGLLAAAVFTWLVDAWLRRAGLPRSHRLPALALVLTGGGLGGLLHALRWPPRLDPLDATTGLFPFVELLANPHFVCGTVLLMGALLLLAHGGARATAGGVALAATAGLVRPYDLVMAVTVFCVATAARDAPRRWAGRALPLAGLLPVVLYDGWLFYGQETYRTFAAEQYAPPPLRPLAIALGPALALALLSRPWPAAGEEARRARAMLWAWAGVGLAIAAARPVPFSLQFLAGIGMPLLALGALGLSRWRPWITAAAAVALCSPALLALRLAWSGPPAAFADTARVEAARALGAACRPGEIAMAPPDVGLYALAHSACTPYASHPVMRDAARRRQEARAFYDEWDPARRRAFLDAHGVTAVVLPAGAGEVPSAALDPASGFVPVPRPSAAGAAFAIYVRGDGTVYSSPARAGARARP